MLLWCAEKQALGHGVAVECTVWDCFCFALNSILKVLSSFCLHDQGAYRVAVDAVQSKNYTCYSECEKRLNNMDT